MKKWLALLMAVAMLCTLCACGKQTKEETPTDDPAVAWLEGAWEMRLNLNALIESDAMGEMPAVLTLMDPATLNLALTTDATFQDGKLTFDPTGMATFYEGLIDAVLDWLSEGDHIYEMMALDSEKTAADFKVALEAQGMSKQDALDAFTSEMPDTDDLAAELLEEMGDLRYALEGDKLYTWSADGEEGKSEDSYFQFTYADDTITVVTVADGGQITSLNDGEFVFVKK